MQKTKKTTPPRVFSTYFQPINHVYETTFSKHNFKQPDAFQNILNFRYVNETQNFGIITRGRSRTAATSKVELFVIIVNGWKLRKKKMSSVLSLLTLYFPMFPFDPPENIRKPLVF